MNIVLITSERLFEFPPVITLLHTLDRMEQEVTYITPYHDEDFDGLGLRNTRHLSVARTHDERLTRYYENRYAASAAFHTERWLRSQRIRQIPDKFRRELDRADVVWVLHENTFLLGGKAFADKLGPYLYTMYELCIKNGHVPEIYDYAARKALLTVVPEYNRSHIVKAYYALPHMPCIIPNKPLDHPRSKNLPISDPVIADKMAAIKKTGKKILMYMGILSSERPLEPIIEAVEQLPEYTLAVLGGRTPYLDRLEKTMAGRFEYLGSVKPPHHLNVASHADITYISYVAGNHSINAVFCAPNKVYEFAGFGIPMLCNDNPGLKYTVEYEGMGVCVPELTTPHIAAALKKIDANAQTMSEAANRYYDAESLEQAVALTLERYCAIRKEVP
jgi:glycosyltransferase involved in cell wall biosynthesis